MIALDNNIRSTYKRYRKPIGSAAVDRKTHADINNMMMKLIFSLVLEGEEVELPGKCGTLMVVGTKRKNHPSSDGRLVAPPNWVKTKALWERNPEAKEAKKLVYHLNENTGGVSYRVYWNKRGVVMPNKDLFRFRLTRDNKREISRRIDEGKEYIITKEL